MVITACALLAASLTAVAPDDAAASPDVPAVPSSIVAPNWGDHGKKAGGAPARAAAARLGAPDAPRREGAPRHQPGQPARGAAAVVQRLCTYVRR